MTLHLVSKHGLASDWCFPLGIRETLEGGHFAGIGGGHASEAGLLATANLARSEARPRWPAAS